MPDDPIADPQAEDGFHDPEADRDDAGSIADRAGNGDDPPEMFPLGSLEGDQRTLGNLTRGKPVNELTVSLGAAEIPLRGGLLDPSRLGRAIVTYEPAQFVAVPERETQSDGSRKIVGWKVRNVTRAVYAEALPDDPGDLARWALERLIAADPQQAAQFADQVQAMVAEYLRSGEHATV